MNLDQLLPQENTSNGTGLEIPDVSSSIQDALVPFMLLSVVVSAVFVVFYVLAIFRRRKLENALFDIQKNISEMNERDKARNNPTPPSVQPERNKNTDRIIARTDEQI